MCGAKSGNAEGCDTGFKVADPAFCGASGQVFENRLEQWHQVLSQDAFCITVRFEKSRIEKANGFRLLTNRFNKDADYGGYCSSRGLIIVEAVAQLLTDSHTLQP